MAYFSNGTEGLLYREAYCDKCRWDKDQRCPIWNLHLRHNYDECNKADSFLHALIPRRKAPQFGNEECYFFMPEPSIGLPLGDPTP
jgi:hypothetical protein